MGTHLCDLGTLTLGTAATANSTSVINCDDAKTITVFAPAALTGTITVQVSPDDSSFFDLTSGGSDVTVAAGNSVTITDVAWKALRVRTSGTEAATRTFTVQKTIRVGRS